MATITRFTGVRPLNAPPPVNHESELSIFVLFTSMNRTRKALEKAREMARSLGTGIVIVAAEVVPYPLPLDEPPVPFDFLMRQLQEDASRSPEKIRISAYLCRDPMKALKQVLTPHCPIVMGIKKRWWPTRDERLARKLLRAGYDVVLADQE